MNLQDKLRTFRKKVLRKTLKDLSNESGVGIQTISAFENGKSNNIYHLKLYVKSCEDNMQFLTLINLIKETLEEVRNEND